MARYSLEFFVLLVQGRLRDSEAAEEVGRRIEILIEDLTRHVKGVGSSYFKHFKGKMSRFSSI